MSWFPLIPIEVSKTVCRYKCSRRFGAVTSSDVNLGLLSLLVMIMTVVVSWRWWSIWRTDGSTLVIDYGLRN